MFQHNPCEHFECVVVEDEDVFEPLERYARRESDIMAVVEAEAGDVSIERGKGIAAVTGRVERVERPLWIEGGNAPCTLHALWIVAEETND